MKHPGIKMIRLIEAICIILTVIVGSALSVYSADDLVGDDVPTSEADTDSVVKNRNNTLLLPVEDLSQDTTSLTVNLTYMDEEQQKTIPVTGATIDLFKVADLVVHNGAAAYVLTSEFESSGIDFEGMTASESLEAAEKLYKIIDSQSLHSFATSVSDSNGLAKFSSLDPGMYLGRQREMVKISDTKKITMEPVLWMTPMYVLNETQDMYTWDYYPVVFPKEGEIERIPTPTFTPTPTLTPTVTPAITITPIPTKRPTVVPGTPAKTNTTTSTVSLVKTGDQSPIGMFLIITFLAIIVIVVILRKKKS